MIFISESRFQSPNLLIELGIAIGKNLPVILFTEQSSTFLYDYQNVYVVTASIDDLEAVKFHLNAFVHNVVKKRKPRRRKGLLALQSITDENQSASQTEASVPPFPGNVETFVEKLLEQNGVIFKSQPKLDNSVGGNRPDIAFWLEEGRLDFPNPVIMEIKNQLNQTSFIQASRQLHEYLITTGLQVGLLVYFGFQEPRLPPPLTTLPLVLPIHINELSNLLRGRRLADKILRTRNAIAHGGTPSW